MNGDATYRPAGRHQHAGRVASLLILTLAGTVGLTHVTGVGVAAQQPVSGSIRLTFHFEPERVELARVEHLRKVSPGQVLPLPVEGRNSGAWLVLVDANGKALFHRLLDDPFRMRAELHSPGTTPSAHFRSPTSGEFQAIVPDDPATQSVVLIASPRDPGRTAEPATELARFRIDTRAN